jgi:hypothetical protein
MAGGLDVALLMFGLLEGNPWSIVGGGGTNVALTAASTSTYWALSQGLEGNGSGGATVEARFQHTQRRAGTYSMLTLRIGTNGRGTATTIAFRKNTADGNQVISVGAGLTGWFQDDTHEDNVVSGDLINWRVTTGTGSGSFQWTGNVVTKFVDRSGDNRASQIVACENNRFGLLNFNLAGTSTVRYAGAAGMANGGAFFTSTTNLGLNYNRYPVDGTLSHFQVIVTANPRADTNTISVCPTTASPPAGATSLDVSIGPGLTGTFEDASDSVAVTAGDSVMLRASIGAGSGTLIMSRAAATFTAAGFEAFVMAVNQDSAATLNEAGDSFLRALGSVAPSTTEATTQTKSPFAFRASQLQYRQLNPGTNIVTVSLRKNGADTGLVISMPANVGGAFWNTTDSADIAKDDLFNYRVSDIDITGATHPFYAAMKVAA